MNIYKSLTEIDMQKRSVEDLLPWFEGEVVGPVDRKRTVTKLSHDYLKSLTFENATRQMRQ
jgi:hypothetical protein